MFDRNQWKRIWRQANRERLNTKERANYQINKDKILRRQKVQRDSNLEVLNKRRRTRYHLYLDKSRAYLRSQAVKLKEEMFENLGKICACCGLNDLRFLSLDHINNDGWKEKYPGGKRLIGIRVAKRSSWDKTKFQILCYNCNLGKNANSGVCPHQQPQSSVGRFLKVGQEAH